MKNNRVFGMLLFIHVFYIQGCIIYPLQISKCVLFWVLGFLTSLKKIIMNTRCE